MLVLSRKMQEAVVVGGCDASNRLQPSDEVLKARLVGNRIKSLPAGGRSLRVLVADDNRDAADSMSVLVTLWGHEVRQTYDGAAALEMAAAYRPDVLLLDISMPKMDGCQLAKQLRRQTRFTETLLVAITGWADKTHRLLGQEAGFDHFLPKPVEPSMLEGLLLLQYDRLAESPEVRLRASRK
jgi:CheY-like chemotaxis protein